MQPSPRWGGAGEPFPGGSLARRPFGDRRASQRTSLSFPSTSSATDTLNSLYLDPNVTLDPGACDVCGGGGSAASACFQGVVVVESSCRNDSVTQGDAGAAREPRRGTRASPAVGVHRADRRGAAHARPAAAEAQTAGRAAAEGHPAAGRPGPGGRAAEGTGFPRRFSTVLSLCQVGPCPWARAHGGRGGSGWARAWGRAGAPDGAWRAGSPAHCTCGER